MLGNDIDYIQRVTEISTLILTSNRTRHDEQYFHVPLFPNRQFFLHFPPHKLTSRSAVYVNLQGRVAKFVKNFKQF
jgi:hypothetical protein